MNKLEEKYQQNVRFPTVEQYIQEADKEYPYHFDEGEQGHAAEVRERKAYIEGLKKGRDATIALNLPVNKR